jgi:hypothetical protein
MKIPLEGDANDNEDLSPVMLNVNIESIYLIEFRLIHGRNIKFVRNTQQPTFHEMVIYFASPSASATCHVPVFHIQMNQSFLVVVDK